MKYRIVFKILLITFKAIHGLAPAYISELISVRDATGRHNLRSNNGLRLNHSSRKSLATLGDRSFHVAAPKLWKDLPCLIRNVTSVYIILRKQLRPFYLGRLFKSTCYFLHTFYVYTFLLLVNCGFLVFIFFYHCYAQLKIFTLIIAQYKFIHYYYYSLLLKINNQHNTEEN